MCAGPQSCQLAGAELWGSDPILAMLDPRSPTATATATADMIDTTETTAKCIDEHPYACPDPCTAQQCTTPRSSARFCTSHYMHRMHRMHPMHHMSARTPPGVRQAGTPHTARHARRIQHAQPTPQTPQALHGTQALHATQGSHDTHVMHRHGSTAPWHCAVP